jgi:hypothetical protein
VRAGIANETNRMLEDFYNVKGRSPLTGATISNPAALAAKRLEKLKVRQVVHQSLRNLPEYGEFLRVEGKRLGPQVGRTLVEIKEKEGAGSPLSSGKIQDAWRELEVKTEPLKRSTGPELADGLKRLRETSTERVKGWLRASREKISAESSGGQSKVSKVVGAGVHKTVYAIGPLGFAYGILQDAGVVNPEGLGGPSPENLKTLALIEPSILFGDSPEEVQYRRQAGFSDDERGNERLCRLIKKNQELSQVVSGTLIGMGGVLDALGETSGKFPCGDVRPVERSLPRTTPARTGASFR